MFRQMPVILIALIAGLFFFSSLIPIEAKSVLYSISLSLKQVIIFLLPLIIFGLLFNAVVNLAHQATKLLLLVLVSLIVSNFLATFLSHYVGEFLYQVDFTLLSSEAQQEQVLSPLSQLWDLALTPLVSNDKAMIAAAVLSLSMSRFKPHLAHQIAHNLIFVVNMLLRYFVYIIPFFVAGFIIKMIEDQILTIVIQQYSMVFGVVLLSQFLYISLAFSLLSGLKFQPFLGIWRHMVPAMISGFTTMSSAVSMPLNIMGTSRHVKDKEIAQSVIPMTVNIHLIGDCIAIPIFAYAVMKSFGVAEPSLMNYLIFVFFFVMAKFSVAAVPGGGILVMLPILESYLGFTSPMLSFITTLYILFDPLITCTNILGNSAFAKWIDYAKSIIK